ncbi:MAG: DUF4357 domain-containing protein [Erythrobacter sp.]|uniref:DUF4357 domain-containing protein n=1 Tax=Erythrobacter sp. TaxID=1042 RepID=UPI002620A1DD|nr:DUF4357 domain-containing protein [Erythrobacter sp.]MDJ0978729.1 DUF4357 domain-containing protein [Erythrobacter sp.]
MQIEIDFDVFKALTALRKTEEDTYNSVIRRLLKLEPIKGEARDIGTVEDILGGGPGYRNNLFQLLAKLPPSAMTAKHGNFLNSLTDGGAWYSNVFFPEGTLFRASYKGQTYAGEIREGCWVDQEGNKRTSPSDAASAISGNNVNGWKFWYAKRPSDDDWVKLDELKQ